LIHYKIPKASDLEEDKREKGPLYSPHEPTDASDIRNEVFRIHPARHLRLTLSPQSLILHIDMDVTASQASSTSSNSASTAFCSGPTSYSKLLLLKLGVVWVVVIIWSAFSLQRSQRRRNTPGHRGGTKLLRAVCVCLPFIGIRVTYTLVLIFTNMQKLVNAPLGLRVGLTFIPEVIVALVFVVVGFWTKNIALARFEVEETELIDDGGRDKESARHLYDPVATSLGAR